MHRIMHVKISKEHPFFYSLVLISFISFFVFISRLFKKACPVHLEDKYASSFFCYNQKVPINCIDEKYLGNILNIITRKDIAQQIYAYLMQSKNIEELSHLEHVKGVGPQTLKNLSKFFNVKRSCY